VDNTYFSKVAEVNSEGELDGEDAETEPSDGEVSDEPNDLNPVSKRQKVEPMSLVKEIV